MLFLIYHAYLQTTQGSHIYHTLQYSFLLFTVYTAAFVSPLVFSFFVIFIFFLNVCILMIEAL